MFSKQIHYLKDDLGQTYGFTLWPQSDLHGNPRQEALTLSKVYARQTLDSIAGAQADPFHYSLMDLWLEVFQKPWARPRTMQALIDDLAAKVAAGELHVYLEDSPILHGQLKE